MKFQVTVQVSLDVGRALHQHGTSTTESRNLYKIVEKLGLLLAPMHPGAKDPSLIQFFIVEAPDLATAELAISRLQKSKAVEAVYLKPPDELP